MEQMDVVVVGAGPVGLLAAIELTLGGARVLVLERLAAPSIVLKAGGIGPLGIETLQRRGMAAAIAAAQARVFAAMPKSGGLAGATGRGPKISGHFGGLTLIRADAQKEPQRLGSPVDQQAIEAMLADRAHALGIEVRRDCDVTGLVQHADGVDVDYTAPRDKRQIRCAYLVGCDGGRSPVRKLAGFAFPGTDATLTMYQAVAEIDHPERLLPGGFRYTPGGMFFQFFGRLAMMDFSGPPADRQAPITHEELETVLRNVSGADVRIKTFENASRWTDNTRLADTYRRGRVLLAGDAAHIHSPFGGQGMSLGLADAANLGWKLAAVVSGEMPERLLDTYNAERRPVAEAVLANTRAQAAIMRPDPQSAAMRTIVANLMQLDDANRFFGAMMSGLSVRYDLGSARDDVVQDDVVQDDAGLDEAGLDEAGLDEAGLDEVGRLIGDRPIRLGDTDASLYDLMQDGMGVLLDASTGGEASKLVAAATRKVRCVPVDSGPSMLIRPDACVAWAAHGIGTDGLKDALRRWFKPMLGTDGCCDPDDDQFCPSPTFEPDPVPAA